MDYKVLVVSGSGLMGTNYQKATDHLAQLVNEAMREGWKPQGGIAVGDTQMTKEPYLMQAMVKG